MKIRPQPKTFYGIGAGDALIDPAHYPPEIKQFLEEETFLLMKVKDSFDTLVEVGCMQGRFLDWAVSYGKHYLGIDVVSRYIEIGQQEIASRSLPNNQYQCILGDAKDLPMVVKVALGHADTSSCLAFFPFNAIGNMPEVVSVLRALKQGKFRFLITAYQTTKLAIEVRKRYYQQCGYQGIATGRHEEGICFTSWDGLCTWAYHPQYLEQLVLRLSLPTVAIPFAEIGMVYLSTNLSSLFL